MRFGGVVLDAGRLLLHVGAGRLDDARGVVGVAAHAGGRVDQDDARAVAGRDQAGHQARAARAHHHDVGLLVPRAVVGRRGGHREAHRRRHRRHTGRGTRRDAAAHELPAGDAPRTFRHPCARRTHRRTHTHGKPLSPVVIVSPRIPDARARPMRGRAPDGRPLAATISYRGGGVPYHAGCERPPRWANRHQPALPRTCRSISSMRSCWEWMSILR